MEEILSGILTMDFWFGFVGAVVATAWLSMPVIEWLTGPGCKLPRKIVGILVAISIGTLIAWLWATIDGGLKLRALLQDGIINGAASSLAYENIVRPWLAKRKAAGV